MSVAREQPQPRPQSERRYLVPVLVGLALALVIGFGLWAYNRTRPEAAVVTRRDIVGMVAFDGEVVVPPGKSASVGAPFAAPVEKVMASVGTNVRRGDVLLTLDFPSAEAAAAQAQANVKAAETAYADARRTYGASVDAAKRQLDEARATEKNARSAGTTASAPDATGTAEAAPPAADLQSATDARVAAEQSLADAQAQMQAALEPYQQQLDAARETYRQAQSGEKLASVRAPIRGTVMVLNARPGQTVDPNSKTPLTTIIDLDALQIQGEVKNEQVPWIKPGREAKITFAQLPGKQFDGEVRSLVTDPGRGLIKRPHYVGVVHVKNEGGQVKPGMKGTAGVKTGEAKGVLAVPNDAVKMDQSGRPTVNVMQNGKWVPTVVEIGLSDGEYTEIKSGLKEGDTVQVKPTLLGK